ncbi:hypothetical protein [Kitasatospora sp. NPDC088134]|uniref:hypothetical protein n=1 Tax=Kitasatospora sp. NPDC088134 TaxID=3364071 RepID=UPI0037F1299B
MATTAPDLPPGTLRVAPDDLRAWSASVLDIARSFQAVGAGVEDETTDAYVALADWLTGPALRERSIRWDDQESTLGNLLVDVAERLRRTADSYTAADATARRGFATPNGGW